MLYRTCIALILTLAAAQAQPAIPDTPAGHTFKAWLEAFNSGDRAALDAYYHKYEPAKSVDNMMQFRGQTGGFDLLAIEKSEPLELQFLVKERQSDTRALGKMEVKDGDPAEVTSFTLRAIPPGASVSDFNFKIDAATRNKVIDGAIANLNEFYVSPDLAKKMEDAVRARQKKGD